MGLIAVFPEVDRRYKKRSIALKVTRGFPQGLDTNTRVSLNRKTYAGHTAYTIHIQVVNKGK